MPDPIPARFEGDVIVRQPDVADHQARIVADERGLFIDDRFVVPNDGFVGAAVERIRDDGQCRLLLVYDDRGFLKITLLVPDVAAARAVARALGIDAEQRVTRVSFSQSWDFRERYLPSILLSLLIGVLFVSANGFNPIGWLVMFIVVLASHRFVQARAKQTTLTVGADGVLRERFMRNRYVSFGEIARVVKRDGGLFLELRDGGAVRLIRRKIGRGAHSPMFEIFAELLSLQIQSALEMRRELARASVSDALVARRGRPPKKWIDDLRSTPPTGDHYRTLPPVEAEHLSRLVADASRADDARIGAAIALRAREGESVAPQLRVAASTTASPKLRRALEKIAEGAPDDEIARSIVKMG